MRLAILVLCLVALPALTRAQDNTERSSPLPQHLPLGKEACFGRVYDGAHLKAHPKQRVTSFYLFRNFTPDDGKEMPQEAREKLIADDGQGGGVQVMAYVRFRDRAGLFFNGLNCRKYENAIHCCWRMKASWWWAAAARAKTRRRSPTT
jgi:hypothetical protein